jgi:hypothetical protein
MENKKPKLKCDEICALPPTFFFVEKLAMFFTNNKKKFNKLVPSTN